MNTKQRLNNRFDYLFKKSDWYKFSNLKMVHDFSGNLDFYSKVVLGYGLSFDVGIDKEAIFDFILSFDSFQKNNNLDKNIKNDLSVLKGFFLDNLIHKIDKGNNLPDILYSALMKLRRNIDIIIMKTDKGGGVVVMRKEDYEEKLSNLLFNLCLVFMLSLLLII